MKIKHLPVLLAGLFAAVAMAQPSATTKMTTPNSAQTATPGEAQGRAPTAINTPQQGSNVKATPVPGSVVDPAPKGAVTTKPYQTQGATSTAAGAAMQSPGAHTETDRKTVRSETRNERRSMPAETLTTPAPGPANTTPSATSNTPPVNR